MRVVADLQVHSKYARATSPNMDLEHIASGARSKGLNLVGTGDFTHPEWLKELKTKLMPAEGCGVYTYLGVSWILTGEVSTVYEKGGKVRKVHHLLIAPDFDAVDQVNELLASYSNLASDGRPVLRGLTSPSLVELVYSVSSKIVVIPAHAWTPWFSVFGSRSGFDSLEECYEDQTKRIFAIETGLSSDPPMNWRLSSLDGVSLISNSDAHSPTPWRLGKEANVFELQQLTYDDVFNAIRSGEGSRFPFTIEVDPAYGKYHYTGHRRCGVSLPPREAASRGNRCPKCGRKLTMGVLQRVEELADRPEAYVRPNAVAFKRLLPLYEVISFSEGKGAHSKRCLEIHDRLVGAFGSELQVMLEVPRDALLRHSPEHVVDTIIAVREGRLEFEPGYDGLYGRPRFA